MAKLLVVDDELTMLQALSEMLRRAGHEVLPFSDAGAALAALATETPDLVITDLYLEAKAASGLEIVKHARQMVPPPVVVVITGFGTIETAVEAMRLGAFDYLEKPFQVEDLYRCIHRALSYNAAVSETVFLRKQLKKKYQFNQIIGNSAPMLNVFKMIERVAETDSTVLILGESGTGKELVARALHFNSQRQKAPFIPVNCSALPETLLESELFGHRRGSFTGALSDKKGLFEAANGGTIFLDEVGSMSQLLQSRLLRVLQEREVRRIGENSPIYVNVRVLAASNEPLEAKIRAGKFREDLFYRLNVIPLRLPGLRERLDDIPVLVAHFLRSKTPPRSGTPMQITRQALDILCRHDWPGNVRELENAIERASVLCDGNLIRRADLPQSILAKVKWSGTLADPEDTASLPPIPGQRNELAPIGGGKNATQPADVTPTELVPLRTFLRQQEQAYIQKTIEVCNGDKEQAALSLGISLATLYRKLSESEP